MDSLLPVYCLLLAAVVGAIGAQTTVNQGPEKKQVTSIEQWEVQR